MPLSLVTENIKHKAMLMLMHSGGLRVGDKTQGYRFRPWSDPYKRE